MWNYTTYDLTKRVAKILEVQDDGQFVCWLNTTLSESNYRLVEILDALTTKIESSEKVQAAFPDFTDDDQFYRYLDDHYVAWKLWSREDIRDYLEDTGYPATDQNVDAVISCDLSNLRDSTEDDWAIIDMAVYKAKTAGKLIGLKMIKNLTISSAPYRAHGERIIPFEGPIVSLLGGPCAPVAIYDPRWEARAKDEEGKPYIVIWETDSDTFDPEPDPDYVL